ncbi:hypothetical protein K504DRAFT_495590 [Pleomassaria siparia CBS 279.74]|uniref:Uncharacterized protein n=1 Tax=Pleomassaria siparia CBS 279.74 TaxID=1314801 RepID=A0A6G1JT31_9PLEO|nr:hypothetical protein K504DRAFT_495590 [Pleomassaria siparia CBS 279.74]
MEPASSANLPGPTPKEKEGVSPSLESINDGKKTVDQPAKVVDDKDGRIANAKAPDETKGDGSSAKLEATKEKLRGLFEVLVTIMTIKGKLEQFYGKLEETEDPLRDVYEDLVKIIFMAIERKFEQSHGELEETEENSGFLYEIASAYAAYERTLQQIGRKYPDGRHA